MGGGKYSSGVPEAINLNIPLRKILIEKKLKNGPTEGRVGLAYISGRPSGWSCESQRVKTQKTLKTWDLREGTSIPFVTSKEASSALAAYTVSLSPDLIARFTLDSRAVCVGNLSIL